MGDGALGAAAMALAAIRSDTDTLRDAADRVTAQRAEAEGQATLRLPDGDRPEAFVLRMAVAADGQLRRCVTTHVRTGIERAWASWAPAEMAAFVAGKIIGGTKREVNLVVTNTRAAGADTGYRATLAARRLGAGAREVGWEPVQSVPAGFPAEPDLIAR